MKKPQSMKKVILCDYGMTDYPKFDYKQKTISCPYPEGELYFNGISAKEKDTIIVNGKNTISIILNK